MRGIPFALSALLGAAAATPARPQALVLDGVTVIDVESGRAQPGLTVIVEGERIAEVGRRPQLRVPPGARVVDGTGRFLIPGLWDMHVHVAFGDWFPGAGHRASTVRGQRRDGRARHGRRPRRARRVAPGDRAGIPRRAEDGDRAGPCSTARSRASPARWRSPRPRTAAGRSRDLKARGADFVKSQQAVPATPSWPSPTRRRRRASPSPATSPRRSARAETSDLGQKSIEHLSGSASLLGRGRTSFAGRLSRPWPRRTTGRCGAGRTLRPGRGQLQRRRACALRPLRPQWHLAGARPWPGARRT